MLKPIYHFLLAHLFIYSWTYAQPEFKLPKISEINKFCKETRQEVQRTTAKETAPTKPNRPTLTIPKIDTIPGTKKLHFEPHTALGYYTIFEFSSPAHQSTELARMARKRPEILFRKIDASFDGVYTKYEFNKKKKQWQPIKVKKYIGEAVIHQFKIKDFPYYILCGANGRELMRGNYYALMTYLRQHVLEKEL